MVLGFLDRAVLAVLNERPAMSYTAPQVSRRLRHRYNVNAIQGSLERLTWRGYLENPLGHPGLFLAAQDQPTEIARYQ